MTISEFNNSFLNLNTLLRGFAYNLTNNWEDAVDLVQETAYRALKNREKFQDNTNFKAWVLTIMKNIFINDYRRKSKRNTIFDNSEDQFMINNLGPTTENTAGSSIMMDELTAMVRELKDEIKIPFLMHYEGYKYQEIADHLDLPLGTIKSRIFFARKELKEKVLSRYESLELIMN